MIERHLQVLLVVLPLAAAPVCILLRRRSPVHFFSLGVCWATFFAALRLLYRVLHEGALSYELGGWPAPWGIEYRLDILGGFLVVFVSAIAALVLTAARRSMMGEILAARQYLFHAAYLLCLTGLLGIVSTGDLFNLFVFIEISSLSAYILIGLGKSRRALTAAFQYLVIGTIGATFILIGIGLLYQMTGTLNMGDMAVRLAGVGGLRTVYVAFAFMCVGIGLKMAMFPLHFWMPNAYSYAPSIVSAFLAGTATKVAIYVFLRFFFTIIRGSPGFEALPLGMILIPLAVAGVFISSAVAIYQRNVRRMLAYSSVAQIGYILLGVGLVSVTGLTGAVVHLFNHALMKGALFLALACVVRQVGSVDIDALGGIGRRMPVTMAAWTLAGLGMIGVPLTTGFVSKWYLVTAALEQRGAWPVAVFVLLGSLLAIVYVWRVVEVAYFREPSPVAARAEEVPLSMMVPTCLLSAATLVFGIWTSQTVRIARLAAEALLQGGAGS